MDYIELTIPITPPARKVSRRNYRHPRRLYHRAARLQNGYAHNMEWLISIANGPAETLRDLARRNAGIFALNLLRREISK